jgi:hypothetical protein
MVWAYGSYVGGRLLVLGSTVVLARVLTPDDFGLVALALTGGGDWSVDGRRANSAARLAAGRARLRGKL